MRIQDLIEGFEITATPRNAAGVRVCDLTEDSRTALPGSLFIARTGEKADGRRFVADAVAAGAVAVLTDDPLLDVPASAVRLVAGDLRAAVSGIAERFHGSPSGKLPVIGVTGTNGKTTITFLLHQALNRMGVRSGMMGTVMIDDGVETARATHTTPPAQEVSRTLGRMHEAGCRAAVMEVSSHALHQRRVGAVRFAAGVFTNLTGDHLDYHKTMGDYGAAKAMLFEGLDESGVAVVNAADPAHERMLRDCRARIVRCAPEGWGSPGEPLHTFKVLGSGRGWTELELAGPWGRQRVRSPLIGDFNAMNMLQAFTTAHAVFGPGTAAGLAPHEIAGSLAEAHAPPGRLQPVTREGDPITVLVDYAHTDDALGRALGAVRSAMRAGPAHGRAPHGRLWCVFGCGGDRDRTKRPRMGAVAADLADRVVITSDNPRTEDPGAIIGEVLAGVPPSARGKVVTDPDRERAIGLAIGSAAPGDAVLIAGKGHEDYQILPDPDRPGSTLRRHFDDGEVARAALGARGIEPEPAAAAAFGPASNR